MPSRKNDAPPAEPVREVQLAQNRKARFDYQIESRLEAGIALRGTEIKSLRAGHAHLRDGYARVENGEVWLRNVHIAPWANSAHDNHDPLRPRKLLLHKDEITRVWMLRKVLAVELARYNITANAIGPGFIDTPMTADIQRDTESWRERLRRVPLGRIGQPLDVANTALFLASEEGRYYTGSLLHPDGGIVMQ